jgi:hypothetical protein
MRLAVVVLFACVAAGAAQEAWPPRVADVVFRPVDANALPDLLRSALRSYDAFTRGSDSLPASLRVSGVDLNGDSVEEFIVQSPEPYSGGPMLYVFARRDGRFVVIADAQGTVYLGPRENGYAVLVSQSRGGARRVTRIIQRYDGTRYRVVRIADYEQSDDDTMRFLEERDPREFGR